MWRLWFLDSRCARCGGISRDCSLCSLRALIYAVIDGCSLVEMKPTKPDNVKLDVAEVGKARALADRTYRCAWILLWRGAFVAGGAVAGLVFMLLQNSAVAANPPIPPPSTTPVSVSSPPPPAQQQNVVATEFRQRVAPWSLIPLHGLPPSPLSSRMRPA